MKQLPENFWRKLVLVGVIGIIYAQISALPAIGITFLPVTDDLKRSLYVVLLFLFAWAVGATWIHLPESFIPDLEDMADVKRRSKRIFPEMLRDLKKSLKW